MQTFQKFLSVSLSFEIQLMFQIFIQQFKWHKIEFNRLVNNF